MNSQQVHLLAYYHLIGGVLGCMMIIIALFGNPTYSKTEWLMIGVASTLYSFGIYCGFIGIKGKARLFLRLIVPYQLIQIVMFSFDRVFAYKFFSGLAIVIGVPLKDELIIGFKLNISTFFVSWDRPIESFIGINLVAVAITIWVAKHLAGLDLETKELPQM
jgi:uncharacterized membrane protein YdcZ (DUF606 family)